MQMKITITNKVWEEIKTTIGNAKPEAGGILGIRKEKIVAYYFDRTGLSLENKYIPDVGRINRVIADWAECGVSFCGFIHSHPLPYAKPSYGDIEYVKKILKNNELKKLYLLIYLLDSNDEILLYELYQNGMVCALEYKVI